MTGGWHLIRLILRRDRVLLPLWVLILAALPAVYAASFAELTPTEEARALYAETTAGIPSIEAMLGPIYGSSVGALATQRAGLTLLIVALINVLVVIRHTRTEEDAGRRELIAATVVGRHAPLGAALVVGDRRRPGDGPADRGLHGLHQRLAAAGHVAGVRRDRVRRRRRGGRAAHRERRTGARAGAGRARGGLSDPRGG